jgi:chromosome segregation ATPase
MNDASPRERFLQAESEARRLASVLENLRGETESYQTVRRTLDDVARSTSASAEALQPVLEGVQDLLNGLSDLGIPEFREDLSEVRQALARVEETLRTMREADEKAMAELRSTIEYMTERRGTDLEVLQRVGRESIEVQQRHGWATTAAVLLLGVLIVLLQLVFR